MKWSTIATQQQWKKFHIGQGILEPGVRPIEEIVDKDLVTSPPA